MHNPVPGCICAQPETVPSRALPWGLRWCEHARESRATFACKMYAPPMAVARSPARLQPCNSPTATLSRPRYHHRLPELAPRALSRSPELECAVKGVNASKCPEHFQEAWGWIPQTPLIIQIYCTKYQKQGFLFCMCPNKTSGCTQISHHPFPKFKSSYLGKVPLFFFSWNIPNREPGSPFLASASFV
jgi:hypothetical protein